MAALPHKPHEILCAAAGLLSSKDDLPGRHRRPGREQINARQRRLCEPARCIEPARQPDHGNLAAGQSQRLMNKPITVIEWRVTNYVIRARLIAAKKIDATIEVLVAAIRDVGGMSDISGMPRGFGNSTNADRGVPDGPREFLDREQPFGTPVRLHVESEFCLGPDSSMQRAATRFERHGTNFERILLIPRAQ